MKLKLLIISLMFLFVFVFQNNVVHGQELLPSPTPIPTVKFIEYDLAFPGMLPDSFLYKLKVLRDKISYALISNPKKKMDFLLLQTDKGILATAMLIDKGEIDLAQETALKAENNYTQISDNMHRFLKQPDQAFFDKLKTASLKHQEVLQSVINRVPESKQKVFKQVVEFSQRNYQYIEKQRADMWK